MRLSLLLNLTLLTTAFALKGSTRTRGRNYGRRAEEVFDPDAEATQDGSDTTQDSTGNDADLVGGGSKQKGNKGDKTKGDSKTKVKSDKGDKKDDKKKGDKKEGKEKKSKKKCKKAKKKTRQQQERRFLHGDDSSHHRETEQNDASLQSDAGSDSGVPVLAESTNLQDIRYCLHGDKTAKVCAALKEGKTPELEEIEKSVSGSIEIDISHDKSQEELLEEVDQILTKTTPTKYLGCQMRRLLQEVVDGDDEIEEVEIVELDEADAALSVVGVNFDNVALSGNGCSWRAKSKGKECVQLTSKVEIFYDGKDEISKEEKTDMFDLLISTVESQAEAGDFEGVGTVERVSSESGSSDGPNIGLVAGTVAGAAALLGAGGYMYKRRRTQAAARSTEKGGETSESDE